ncbi:MAG: adenylate/guanylate cyclase domain-containing protein [Pseudomonadales bacterium]|nr:adenylate/guanylate cyclase domain-containing protein [Pseudomonadales bacterium]
MSQQPKNLVIFFADIAGSTRLYEELGDVVAHECVVESLRSISEKVKANEGVVVEIIGDEVMAYFQNSGKAIDCACDIQQFFSTTTTSHGHSIFVRVGFYQGDVQLDKGHPYGDTVNTASRMASLAQGGQIITTRESVNSASKVHQNLCRPFSEMKVKGKSEALDVVEVIWNEDDATSIFIPTKVPDRRPASGVLTLSYSNKKLELTDRNTPFVIGRGEHCNLVFPIDTASRSHLRIEVRLGEFVVIDHSTNGTYITTPPGKRAHDGLDMRLHHREWTMVGHGKISLGKPVLSAGQNVIEFQLDS